MAADHGSRITVLLADPKVIIRSGLRGLLERDPRFTVVGEAPDDVLTAAQTLQPDLIIVDPAGGGNIDGAVAELRSAVPRASVVILTADFDADSFNAAIPQRVNAYLLASSGADGSLLLDILAVIGRFPGILIDPVIAEQVWCSPTSASMIPAPPTAMPRLTERERTILNRLAEGYSEDQIVSLEGMSLQTVKRTISTLKEKLDAPTLFVLAMKATRLGLIP